MMEPLGILINPAIALRTVVFPMPEGPNKQIQSPFLGIEREIFSKTRLSPAKKSTLLISK